MARALRTARTPSGPWGTNGAVFEAHQATADLDIGRAGHLLLLRQMFPVWVIGLACFGITAIFMILRTLFDL
ncbi:hypothetical protein [Nocardia sp. CA-119907]|uniref:hypothetical protein n=1 Tax=Nocardia sp. CA-119907 TaxID=3239973 RepID=UPI003D99E64B